MVLNEKIAETVVKEARAVFDEITTDQTEPNITLKDRVNLSTGCMCVAVHFENKDDYLIGFSNGAEKGRSPKSKRRGSTHSDMSVSTVDGMPYSSCNCAESQIAYGNPWVFKSRSLKKLDDDNSPMKANERQSYYLVSFTLAKENRLDKGLIKSPCKNCASWVMNKSAQCYSNGREEYRFFAGAIWDCNFNIKDQYDPILRQQLKNDDNSLMTATMKRNDYFVSLQLAKNNSRDRPLRSPFLRQLGAGVEESQYYIYISPKNKKQTLRLFTNNITLGLYAFQKIKSYLDASKPRGL